MTKSIEIALSFSIALTAIFAVYAAATISLPMLLDYLSELF